MKADEHEKVYKYEHYQQYRSELVQQLSDSHKQYDGALLSLSSGALILSVAFLKDIAFYPTAVEIFVLKLSWVCFLVVIILTVVSFLLAQISLHKRIVRAGDAYTGQDTAILIEPLGWAIATERVNACAGISFILAAILTAVFAFCSV